MAIGLTPDFTHPDRMETSSMQKDIALLVDSNAYLYLYGLAQNGLKLVESLEEQQAHIFVSTQIVDEVLRNKLSVACYFFQNSFSKLPSSTLKLPEHMLGIDVDTLKELRNRLLRLLREPAASLDEAAAKAVRGNRD